MYVDDNSHMRPVEQPASLFCDHVNTAMAHRCAKITVPERPVNAVIFIEIHGVGYIAQVITRAGHIVIAQLDPHGKASYRCRRIGQPGGYEKRAHNRIALIGI